MTKVYNIENYAPVKEGDIAHNWDGDKFTVTSMEKVVEFLLAKGHSKDDVASYELGQYALLAFTEEGDYWQGWTDVEIHHHSVPAIFDGSSIKNIAVTIETAEKYCYNEDGSISLTGPNGLVLISEGNNVRGGNKNLDCENYPVYDRADILLSAKAEAWKMTGLGEYPGMLAKMTKAIKPLVPSNSRRSRKALARKIIRTR